MDAIEVLLRAPVLTPKPPAAHLHVAAQTGTAVLRELQAKGLVREVTGRGNFLEALPDVHNPRLLRIDPHAKLLQDPTSRRAVAEQYSPDTI